ncbi:hypothetical protein [Latilactobacillus sakei]|nr:hypothetical protein [Latilactobacillus sakei]QPG02575.1 hypothetical protein INH01_06035 [Latilactobacillus sakei]QVQ48516.1 hypothetical protein KIK01_07845 [Latilactobacillus sakei subsp. sakei]BAX67883.1 hypothetical protein LASAK_00475 [Latilactobacillus sakei]
MSEEWEELRKILIEHKHEADEKRLIGVSACCKWALDQMDDIEFGDGDDD